MRKVLSLVLVLTLVLGSVAMAFAAPADVKGEKFEDAVSVLMDLGVVTGYPDGSYKPAAVVTRAEMAAFIIRALGLSDYSTSSATPFNDVPKSHWASGYINYAFTLGIINGRSATVFDPDATVSYDEAIKMLVCALGYKLEYMTGTYPGAFVAKARALGISDNVQAGSAGANRGDIATLVYQTLPQNIKRYDENGMEQDTTGFDGAADTMAKRLRAVDAGPYVVTNARVNAAVINISDLLGAYVETYENKDGEIIGIKEVKTVFLTGEMDALAPNTKEFETTDDKTYDVTAAAAADFNGGAMQDFTNGEGDAFVVAANTEYTIAAEVSGLTIKRIWSVAVWNANDAGVIEARDLEDIKEDDELFGVALPKDDSKEVDHKKFAVVGADGLNDLKVDDVVTVYARPGAGGTVSRIEVGREEISGKVTQVKGTTYTIGGKGYKFSALPGAAVAGTLTVDDEIEAKLDYDGKIYDYDTIDKSEKKIALVLDTGDGKTGLTGKAAKIKLFLADGTGKVFDLDYKAVEKNDPNSETNTGVLGGNAILDLTTTPGDIAFNAIAQYDTIKYALNSNGEVKSIEKIAALSFGAGGVAGEFSKDGLYDKLAVADDAIIFAVPAIASLSDDPDDYKVVKLANVLGTKTVRGYKYVESTKITTMVIETGASGKDDVFALLLDGAGESSAAEGGFIVDVLIGTKVTNNHYASKLFKAPNAPDIGTPADLLPLYHVKYDSNDEISDLVAVAVGGGAGQAYAILTLNGAVAKDVKVSQNIVTLVNVALDPSPITTKDGPGTWTLDKNSDGEPIFTLAKNVVFYKLNDDGVYEVGSARDLEKAFTKADFYDVVDEDGAFEFVLIQP